MDTTLLIWGFVMPCAITVFIFWLLLRNGKKKPQLEHTATSTEKDTVDKELERDSIEDSEYEIGAGLFFPPENFEDEKES